MDVDVEVNIYEITVKQTYPLAVWDLVCGGCEVEVNCTFIELN